MDSVSVGLMMVQTLDTHWDAKLARERIARQAAQPQAGGRSLPGRLVARSSAHRRGAGPEPAASGAAARGPIDDEDDDDDDAGQRRRRAASSRTKTRAPCAQLLGLPACAGCAPGSNNWVIAGSHTASGKPLLSNDMHLGLTEPNIWFMADLQRAGLSTPPASRCRACRL